MDEAEWDARYEAGGPVAAAPPNQFVAEELAMLPPGRALDLGCGEGRNALWLAARGWRVTGVDFSGAALARAARLADDAGVADQAEWLHGDARDAAGLPGPYDLVVVAYLHLPAADRGRALRAAASLLAPDGTLLVVGHDLRNLTGGVGGPQDPALLFTPEDLVLDLAEVPELSVQRAEPVTRRVETAEGERTAIDALVRFRRMADRSDLALEHEVPV